MGKKILEGYLSKIHIGRPDLNKIFESMRDEVAEEGESHVAVLTCGPSKMVEDAFLKSQQFSKPFIKKEKIKNKSKFAHKIPESTIRGKDFEIKITNKKQIKEKKYKAKFDFHSEIFDF